MAEQINPTKGAVPAATPGVPEFQRQVDDNHQISVPSYGRAFEEYALSSNMLGAFGAKLAQESSNAIADYWGTQKGKDPQGDLLPSITDFDKRVANSYMSQAQATLGLQIQDLMNKGSEELATANQVTPGMIANYNASMKQGIAQIMEAAPTPIKAGMENQYNAQLMQKSHELNLKMISHNKAQANEQAASYTKQQMKSLYDSQFTDNPDTGESIYSNIVENNARRRAAGSITASEEKTSNDSAKMTYLAGKYGRAAQEAYQNGTLPQFLKDFVEKPIDSPVPGEKPIGQSDKENLAKLVMSHVNQYSAFEAQDKSLTLSQGNLAIAQGSVTPDMIQQMREELPQTDFNNWYAKLITTENKRSTAEQKSQELDHDWGTERMAYHQSDEINKGFLRKTSALMERKPDLTPLQAQTIIANSAGVAIPAFNKQLNNDMTSGNPQRMQDSGAAFRALYANNANLVSGVSDEAQQVDAAFHDALSRGQPADVAAQNAIDTIYNADPKELEAINQGWKAFQKDKSLNDPTGRTKFANNLINKPWFSEVQNLTGVQNSVMGIFERNWKAQKGNTSAAKELTERQIKSTYGMSKINGREQYMFMPPEQATGLGEEGVPFMAEEIKQQLAKQFEFGKEAFYKGDTNVHYQVENTKFGELPKITQVSRDVHGNISNKILDMEIVAGPEMGSYQQDNQEMISGYDIRLHDGKYYQSFNGAAFAGHIRPYYRPNKTYLNEQIIKNKTLMQQEALPQMQAIINAGVGKQKLTTGLSQAIGGGAVATFIAKQRMKNES